MDLLGIFYGVIGILVTVGIISLFIAKDEKIVSVIMVIVMVFCIISTLVNVTALPSNFIAQKVIGYIIALVGIVGNYLRFYKKNYSIIPKMIVAMSTAMAFLMIIL